MTRRKKSLFGLPISVLFLLGLAIALGVFQKTLAKMFAKPQANDKLIREQLEAAGYGVTQARGWAIVSRVETGDYSSNLYKTYNNLFGMKQPEVRETTSTGPSPSGFASFNTREASIQDLIMYMEYFSYPKDFATLSAQIKYMKTKGYFEEDMNTYLALAKDARDRLFSDGGFFLLAESAPLKEATKIDESESYGIPISTKDSPITIYSDSREAVYVTDPLAVEVIESKEPSLPVGPTAEALTSPIIVKSKYSSYNFTEPSNPYYIEP